MKYIIAVLFALFAFASANNYKLRTQDDLNLASMECIQAHNVSNELIQKYTILDFPNDETTRCFIECVYEKIEFFNPKDGVKIENVITQLAQDEDTKEKFTAAIIKCNDKNDQGSDPCTWAYRAFKCYQNEIAPHKIALSPQITREVAAVP